MFEKTYTGEQIKVLFEKFKEDVKIKQEAEFERIQAEADARVKTLQDELSVKQASFANLETELSKKEVNLASREKVVSEKENLIRDAEHKMAEVTLLEAAAKAKEDACIKMLQQIKEQAAHKAEEINNMMMESERAAGELRQKRMESAEVEVQKILETASKQAESLRNSALAESKKIVDQAQKQAGDIVSEGQKKADEMMQKAAADTSALQKQIGELQKTNASLSESNTKLVASNENLSASNQALKMSLTKTQEQQREEYDTFQQTLQQYKHLQEELDANGKDVGTLAQEIAQLEAREESIKQNEAGLKKRSDMLRMQENFANKEDSRLKDLQERLDEEVNDRFQEILRNKEEELRSAQNANAELRHELSQRNSISSQLDLFKETFDGKSFPEIFADYKRIQQELSRAHAELMQMPSLVLQKKDKELAEYEEDLKRREEIVKEDKKQIAEERQMRIQAEAEKAQIEKNLQEANEIIQSKEQTLQRYRSTYEDPSTRDERINVINTPHVKDEVERNENLEIKELDWLNDVDQKINEYGLHFPKRILYAFHTALKTAEMSPLTVLAGVSGTGKSELPRLYSLFGGINFLGVPVQPNWDCQESMLGYYNSIDNCFEATDILKSLAQSQRKPEDANGLNDVMTMILLDEMNLANVELYFAEFLSKLETRRGRAESDVPSIGVKIGSKMDDWPLNLGRNVLWIGTMNNDETTKTLSDKVIDRGIIINFPRPKKLVRSKRRVLPGSAPLISRDLWNRWIENAYDFSEEEIRPYLETIENINIHLGNTGRALGHRVWQSIESYMSLYPSVVSAETTEDRKKAMDDAFEDQLVQKVMPKLRGIETRGSQGEALDAIENLIPETLRDDFKNAKQGYGQFIWNSSTYLQKDDSMEAVAVEDEVESDDAN